MDIANRCGTNLRDIMDFAIVATVLLTVASPSLGAGINYIVACIGLVVIYTVYIMHVMVVVL